MRIERNFDIKKKKKKKKKRKLHCLKIKEHVSQFLPHRLGI